MFIVVVFLKNFNIDKVKWQKKEWDCYHSFRHMSSIIYWHGVNGQAVELQFVVLRFSAQNGPNCFSSFVKNWPSEFIWFSC